MDFVAASFVRKAEDVRSIRRFIAKVHSKHWPEDRPTARIISKIENLGEACALLEANRLACSARLAYGGRRLGFWGRASRVEEERAPSLWMSRSCGPRSRGRLLAGLTA